MDQIYCSNILNEKVGLTPSDLKKKKDELNHENIDKILEDKLKKNIEGKCIKQGYVKKGSLKIINRSIGIIQDGHFSGDIVFKVKFMVNVCNPPVGQIINCIAHSINKMGILAGIGNDPDTSPLLVLIARHHHADIDKFKKVKKGDSLSVDIIGKKFELNDTKIHVVAELININDKIPKKKKFIIKKKYNGGDSELTISDIQLKNDIIRAIDIHVNNPNEYIENQDINNIIQNIDKTKWNTLENDDKYNLIGDLIDNKNDYDDDNEIKEINPICDDDSSLLEI